jgi:hypothetical protein
MNDKRALRGLTMHCPTTADFASMDDHARLPWRFFSRLQATEDRGRL